MSRVREIVRSYFEEFDRANNSFDPGLLGPLMGDPVVGADPHGEILSLDKSDFLDGISERRDYLDTLGFEFVKTEPLEEIHLSEKYTLVKTHGIMRLETTSGQTVDLVHDSAYVLYVDGSSAKMIFTLSHEDPMEMAKERGISFPQE